MQNDNIIKMNANRLQPKRSLRAVLFILLLSMTGMTKANPIDFNTAIEVGLKYMNANVKMPIRDINDLQLVTTYNISRGDAAFYIFNISNGFVIVSADDCATPILGYSEEGKFDVENIPIQLQGYLQGFVEQIEFTIENHLEADERIARQWELVRCTGRLTENRGDGVEPLVTALWSQHCYYNFMCPEDPEGPCGHALTGCVATAMGLILHYWGYPEQGMGSHTYTPMPYPTTQYPEQSVNFGETTYDWANMPNQLTDTSSQVEIDAVSTLLWHCGVAVDMNYSPYGSGMEGHFTALMDYFDYSDDMHWEARQDDESWLSLLKADLDLGRPIFYTGYRWANSGHAFVCDGYDANDRFHFNWGWGGSSNGYFALNANMYFVYDNDAIFNIHPNTGTTYQVTASVSLSAGGSVSGSGIYGIGDICTLTATACEDYIFMCWTEDGEVVSTQTEYSFCVRKDRDLVAHFSPSFQSQSVNLSTGYNWFSTNVEITLDDLKAALLDALPDATSITIKSRTQSTRYVVRTHAWNGTLDWDMTQMYKIEVPSACEIALEGAPIYPADHPIILVNGSNWIGYPLSESMSVAAALADFEALNGDVIKSKSGSTRYLNGSWRPNGLDTLEPGQGYIYNSTATDERCLVFPSGTK